MNRAPAVNVVTLVALATLLCPALIAAQSSTAAPNELNLNNNNNNNQSPDTNVINDSNSQQQSQQQQEIVTTRPLGKDQESDDADYFHQPISPPNFFIRPIFPTNFQPYQTPSFGSMFNSHLMDSMRQSQEEFRKLEQQSGEGTETRYISRNGVSYIRTCTTKKV